MLLSCCVVCPAWGLTSSFALCRVPRVGLASKVGAWVPQIGRVCELRVVVDYGVGWCDRSVCAAFVLRRVPRVGLVRTRMSSD